MARYIALVLALVLQVLGHTIITYPGYRGNNLFTNGTVEDTNGLGVAYKDGTYMFPYGMEWIYPCKKLAHHPLLYFKAETKKQAAECPHPPTEPNGPLAAVPSPSNPLGSPATQPPSST